MTAIPDTGQAPRLLFLVTEDWYFSLHRIPLAEGARRAGFQVCIATRDNGKAALLEQRGFRVLPLGWRRGHANPPRLLAELWEVRRLYRRLAPDLIHQVAMKPSLLGSLAAWGLPGPAILNNLAGLGQVFARADPAARLLQGVLKQALRWAFRRPGAVTLVENPDDQTFLIETLGLHPDRARLIRGVGVDVDHFRPLPEPPGRITVTLVSRMLWHKGVGVLADAAQVLRDRGANIRLCLVGDVDPDSTAAVPRERLLAWHRAGLLEWLGHLEDVRAAWRQSHVAVLPSYYREGIPRSLLEAAACGRPIITTDMPGCREIVRHGHNGLLVTPRDPLQLADAIVCLAGDRAARERMGQAGRALVEESFSETRVVAETVSLYRELLNPRRRAG